MSKKIVARALVCDCGNVFELRVLAHAVKPLSKRHRKIFDKRVDKRKCRHKFEERGSGFRVCTKCDKVTL